jgi:hypothetical protein
MGTIHIMIIPKAYTDQFLQLHGVMFDYCEVIRGKFSYIPITKNMSKIMKMSFDQYKRKPDRIKKVDYCSRFTVILRDPLDRWASGIVEFFKLHGYVYLLKEQKFVDDIVTKTLCFDAHTLPQTCFIQEVDTDKCDFFYITPDVNQYLNNFHKERYDIDLNIDDVNNSEYMDIQLSLKQTILSEQNLTQSFREFYSIDYILLNHVQPRFVNPAEVYFI